MNLPFGSWSLLVPFDPFGVKALRKGFETGAVFVAKCIEKHRETLDPSNPRDYIDAFLIEMKGKAASNEEHYFDGSI